jgi:hypothetical protein
MLPSTDDMPTASRGVAAFAVSAIFALQEVQL